MTRSALVFGSIVRSVILRRFLRRFRARDPSAAQYARAVALVKHAGLTRRDRIFGRKQFDLGRTVRSASHARRDGGTHRAHLHGTVYRDLIAAKPVHIAKPDRARGKLIARADDDLCFRCIELEHEQWLAISGESKPLALTDGEMDDAVVAAENATGAIDDLPGRCRIGLHLLHDGCVFAIRDKADVLAVGFVGYDEAEFGRDGAHLTLVHIADGEAQIVELLLRRREQEVALVAYGIDSAVQLCAVRPVEAAGGRSGGRRFR